MSTDTSGAGAGSEASADSVPRYAVRAFGLPSGEAVVEFSDTVAGVRACVAPNRGAELSSLQLQNPSDGSWAELLYRGNDYSDVPDGDWQGKAPNLFPAVGRSFTAAQVTEAEAAGTSPDPCRYAWDGKEHDFMCHGFLMATTDEWELTDMSTDDSSANVTCSMSSAKLPDAVKAVYPHAFDLAVHYRLADGLLSATFHVTAGAGVAGAGMPFSVGNHVTFKFPMVPATAADGSDVAFDAGRLTGSGSTQLDLTSNSLLTGTSTPRPEFSDGAGLSLGNPISCNMVVGGFDDDCSLTLTQPGAVSVKVSQLPTSRDADLKPHKYFVLWGDADKGFFCPEPWLGGPDSLNTGDGLVVLKAGEDFEWTYTVAVTRLAA